MLKTQFLTFRLLPVGHILEHIGKQPFSVFDNPFLVAGGAELSTFARECQKVLMAAVFTPDPGKPHVEISAVQVSIDHSHDVCPPETKA